MRRTYNSPKRKKYRTSQNGGKHNHHTVVGTSKTKTQKNTQSEIYIDDSSIKQADPMSSAPISSDAMQPIAAHMGGDTAERPVPEIRSRALTS
jgi:hypothetical protein